MPKPLVIVESPAKARTIAGFLGPDYVVESSIGGIRDLPRNAADVPAAYRGEAWARLGVDVENGFKPLYVVISEKRSQVSKLKALVRDASEVYLATDEDREGESIAWHLLEVLSPRVPVKRMVFHEITRSAIEAAVSQCRELDRGLVDAQEARRILDRLYGYEVSPVLWKKVMPRLSAGRVQSVATRMVVERERERMAFRAGSWWDVTGTFRATGGSFDARLVSLDGRRLATGRDFTELGRARGDVALLDEAAARAVVERLSGATFAVASVESKPYRRQPYPPFMTSTLQQEAGRKLRWTSHRTMQVAQRLYEAGWITYMRTDSTALSDAAVSAAREQARALYGADYVPERPRRYERKVKNAQEAHEAIRPAGDAWRTPEQAGSLGADERRLYDLVWKRTVASQMADARGTSAQVRILGEMPLGGAVPPREPPPAELGTVAPGVGGPLETTDGAATTLGTALARAARQAELAASGKVITFPGFLRAYVEGADDPEAALEDREVRLPALAVGDPLAAEALEAEGHETQPPPRYTEASLIKSLEDLGVGRPSTYSSIIQTIQDRGYVWKKGSALVPSFVAFAVVGLLERYFADLVDYGFTASMEDDLDEIAAGGEESVPWLSRFYFGESPRENYLSGEAETSYPNPAKPPSGRSSSSSTDFHGRPGLKELVSGNLGEIDAREVNSIPLPVSVDGDDVVVRVGRYGPYVQAGERRASVPEDVAPDELDLERVLALLDAPSQDRRLGSDPSTGLAVLLRAGRFGPYVQLGGESDGGGTEVGAGGVGGGGGGGGGGRGVGVKAPTASLLKTMDPEAVTLEDALRLLSLPRALGVDPADGEEVQALNGRYGPYVKKGSDSRSLASEDQLWTVTLEEALALFAQPRTGRGRAAAAPPLRELGPDPVSGSPMVLREGRFGPYVTDGSVNASLRRGDAVETLTVERAAELLADKRAKGPTPPRTGARRGSPAASRAAGSKKPAGTRSKKPPAAGSKKPPAAGSKKPPAAGSKKPPAAGSKKPPAAGSKKPPAARPKPPKPPPAAPSPTDE
ncbi:MAG: type I DNA topoisomerase [Acidimicrobiales bacterium]